MSARLDLPNRPHGSWSTYGIGCRCTECKDAAKAYRAQRRASAKRGELAITHGTITAYNLGGCRCDRCKSIAADVRALQRQRYQSTPPELIPHGATGYTAYGCRCRTCTQANTDAHVSWMSRKRRARRRYSREAMWRNRAARLRMIESIKSSAQGELLDLIVEQERELRNMHRAPNWLLSLDAPWGNEAPDRYDSISNGVPLHLIEWADPTADAAIAALEAAS